MCEAVIVMRRRKVGGMECTVINSKGMPFSCKVMRTFRAYGEGEAEISFRPIFGVLHDIFEEKDE